MGMLLIASGYQVIGSLPPVIHIQILQQTSASKTLKYLASAEQETILNLFTQQYQKANLCHGIYS